MATFDDVEQLVTAYPDVEEGTRWGKRSWLVAGKVFAWERPYSKADLKRFGDTVPPAEPILAISVEDLHEKEAILAEGTPGVFTITHFDGYAAVLIELGAVGKSALRALLTDAWPAVAPPGLAKEWLDSH